MNRCTEWFFQTKKKCPKCRKFKPIKWVIVCPSLREISGSWYCWNCHIYIAPQTGQEDSELMEIMLEVLAEEEELFLVPENQES